MERSLTQYLYCGSACLEAAGAATSVTGVAAASPPSAADEALDAAGAFSSSTVAL